MARNSHTSRDDPPSSSPAPIRNSQPQPYSPTSTARGTERHHALYDTPPEGTQPPELKRADRSRVKSARLRDTLEYQTRSIPSATKSNVAASQPNRTPASASNPHVPGPPISAPPRPKSRKRPSLRFDGEASSDEDGNPRPRKTRNTGSSENSPPPKPPGRSTAMAPGGPSSGRRSGTSPSGRQPSTSPSGRQSVTLAPAVAHELECIFGIDLSTSTAKSVQRQPPSSVPILKNKGTSQRDRLLTLANPDPSQSQTHGPRQPVSTSEPASTNPVDSHFRNPPPLPVFYHPKSPPPVSSTQCAVVDGGDSQASYTAVRPHVPFTWDYRPSPVPQPSSQFPFPQSTLEPTDHLLRPYQRQSFSPENRSPGAEPSNRRWLNGGLEHAGVQVNQQEPESYHCQSITQPEHVRPDTPPALGSEPEEDQHLSTRAKGKGRANH
ncbi:hypothetical protein BDV93DRAFT_511624 [Ceratobasidium sp. AG-I]|nr:hypothetical protein BDV93DRAFT_511624 [Ceratobasidium sp. AG-I]